MTSLEESVDSRIRVALSAESGQKESKSVVSETDSEQSEEVFPDFALYSVGARIVDSTDTFDRRVESSPVFGSLVVVFEGYDNPPVNVLTVCPQYMPFLYIYISRVKVFVFYPILPRYSFSCG